MVRVPAQSCPTLCDPRDCSPRLPYSWDFPGQNTRVGCHFLPQLSEWPYFIFVNLTSFFMKRTLDQNSELENSKLRLLIALVGIVKFLLRFRARRYKK